MTATTAIRSSQISGLGKVLGISANDKLSDTLHASDGAETQTSGTSAHISFHNAVKTRETKDRKKVTARVRARQRQWLEQEYQKAAKRAEKKGRTLPPKEDYFNLWGTNYTSEYRLLNLSYPYSQIHGSNLMLLVVYGPYPFPPWFTPGLYYGWDPSVVPNGAGAWANCAAYTCGNGGIAAGSCGGPGGCINGNGGVCHEESFALTCINRSDNLLDLRSQRCWMRWWSCGRSWRRRRHWRMWRRLW